jgi:hypothetical protein
MEVFPGVPYSWNNSADIDLSAYALVATPGNAEVRVQSYTLEKQFVGYENIGTFTNQSLGTTSDVQFKTVEIGTAPNTFTLPAADGTTGQVIVTDGIGNTSWETPASGNPFNQNLNTFNDPSFNTLTTDQTIYNETGVTQWKCGIENGTQYHIANQAGEDAIRILQNKLSSFAGSINVNSTDIALFSPGSSDVASYRNSQVSDNAVMQLGTLDTGTSSWAMRMDAGSDEFKLRSGIGEDAITASSSGRVTFPNGVVTADNTTIQLGSTSDVNSMKCVSMLFVANAAIGSGRVVKIVNVGGQARVEVVTAGDPDSEGVIGITMSSTTAAVQDISVCIGGVFNACVSLGATINVGDHIEKTDTPGQDGKLWSAVAGIGTIGVALTGGTGDAAGSVFVKGLFIKNEVL